MPIELRKQRDGNLRPTWYARYEIDGHKHFINLGIKVTGTPPESKSMRDRGDEAFELSRLKAQAKLDTFLAELHNKQHADRILEQLYEGKTGEKVEAIELDDLPDEWARIPRKRKPAPAYAEQCKKRLRKFAAFIKRKNPVAHELANVSRQLARDYLEAEAERQITGKTWNDTLKLLRATFKHLLPVGAVNPFTGIPMRETETVFRKPFTPEELKAITEAAKDDDFIRPIVITGMCTAMRRGDCCLLKWKDVDLAHRFITVKTAKTGVTVDIPIFPMLYDELAAIRKASAQDQPQDAYVFPKQAAMYRESPDGITWRVKRLILRALAPKDQKPPALAQLPPDQARQRGLDHIAKLANPLKRERMQKVFELYMGGKKTAEVASEAGVSKGSVSGYLNDIESAIGCQIIRDRAIDGGVRARLRAANSILRTKREGAARNASIRDFHSFRVTWVTIALTGGVPLELVQKVTGHKTTDIVLKHYFQPGREAFRHALSAAMPALLTNGQKSPKDEIVALAKAGNARNAKKTLARIMELVGKL